jgi:hypothetical protein
VPLPWAFKPGSDDDEVRAENSAGAKLVGWEPFQLRWATRRRWPTAWGWFWLSLPGLFLAVSAWNLATHPIGTSVFAYLIWDAPAAALVLLILRIPALHEAETATFTLQVRPDSIRLEKIVPGVGSAVREFNRLEAGELLVDAGTIHGGGSGFRRYSDTGYFKWVACRSIDGQTELVVYDRSIAGSGFLGHLKRPSVGRAVVSWWPVNRRSRSSIEHYLSAGKPVSLFVQILRIAGLG